MLAENIFKQALDSGVFLYLDGENLKYKVKKGEFPDELKSAIIVQKQAIIDYLKQVASKPEVKETKLPKISPRAEGIENPMSFSQQRLWLLDQLEQGSSHYNIFAALKLTGTIDLVALQQAFSCIVERHESLRTCFCSGDEGEPLQVIQQKVSFTIPITDLSKLSVQERERKITEEASKEAGLAFDLSRDLMLRVQLLKLSDQEHALLLTMHHIASDGWSTGILVKEFSHLYSAFVNGEADPLAPLAIQYADYAHWQRDWLQGVVLDEQLDYWQRQLSDLPDVHSLPLDYPRPAIQGFDGDVHFSSIDKVSYGHLAALCQSMGASLFMGLHAVFSVLLSRYSNERDIVMGTPVANRESSEVSDLIGFFVNTLVLRSDLSGEPSFLEVLADSKAKLLDAYARQQVPFEQVVERVQPLRSLSHNPLFQVLLSLQNNEQGHLSLPGLTLSAIEMPGKGVAKFDLTLNIVESANGLRLGWGYNTALFKSETIAQMAGHFESLLSAVLQSPHENVFSLGMVTEQESRQLLVDWNATAAKCPSDMCMHELFEARAAQVPEREALEYNGTCLSYQELNRRANQLAHYLVAQGVKPDTLVGLCFEHSLDMVVGILAVLKAGAAYVPIDPANPEARVRYMLNDSSVKIVLSQLQISNISSVDTVRVICLDDESMQATLSTMSDNNLPLSSLGLSLQHLAYVIYTSGSTGQPKGVMVEHRNISNLLAGLISTFEVSTEDTFACFASFAFDISLFELFLTLISGGKTILVDKEVLLNLEQFSQVTRQCTLLHAVPSLMNEVVDFKDKNNESFANVRALFVGGDYVPVSLLKRLKSSFSRAKVIELYGPTEATILTTYKEVSAETLNHMGAVIGRGLQNTSLYVLNEAQQLCPPLLAGELYIGGAGVTRGYLNREELTAEKFVANPYFDEQNLRSSERLYRTGDLVRWLPDGELEFIGRIDHQVKIRGFRIELGEIEHALSLCPGVKDSVVIARDIREGDKCLIAYLVASQEEEELISIVRRHLLECLPEHMVPSAFVLLDNLPLNINGKVDRKALPDPGSEVSSTEYIAPCTETERVLCEIWQDILELERVGIQDNFFELGGHSLLAMRILSKTKAATGIEVPLKEIFRLQTVALIADFLDSQQYIDELLYSRDESTHEDEIELKI
ncbi:non-ribosomal peptide synthetase [Pseudoalteromonas luteoviolacea]|uniref:Carrier domain-containing protein n=1 Tax=Pseudoalteromonas luteoviolacea H33 TaxID=1365251 RepID=A0A167BL17_9GAMM|nr:hypothetical protein N476_24060 [Pseudoalteromonas luteoviolacea H33]KZN71084.1 hypothetical protein N477_25730 [Pseudoalteromonas luteoviolacea H33-S]MBQ4880456.1 non-ribosomal peptide synthetase [Pseudoalteromonas luteoviolacea]MBQ4909516.1 non-ribosomal peptide synthetase [Pseudoalteromonas luteoviolacea]